MNERPVFFTDNLYLKPFLLYVLLPFCFLVIKGTCDFDEEKHKRDSSKAF